VKAFTTHNTTHKENSLVYRAALVEVIQAVHLSLGYVPSCP
jgi:hypothetical protein